MLNFDWVGPAGLGLGLSFMVVFWIIFAAILVLLSLFLFVLWVIALVDLVQRKENEFPNGGSNAKNTWLIVLLVSWAFNFSGIAAIIYYFIVMKKMPRKKSEIEVKKDG